MLVILDWCDKGRSQQMCPGPDKEITIQALKQPKVEKKSNQSRLNKIRLGSKIFPVVTSFEM